MGLIVDDREVMEHPDILTELVTPVTIQRLDAGDYIFLDRDNETTCIERCKISDLMQKIRSGRLESQLIHCDELYSKVVLLVEDMYDSVDGFIAQYRKGKTGKLYFRSRIETTFRWSGIKALEIRLSELGIEVFETPNFDCSMKFIDLFYQQRTRPEEQHTMFKKIRKVKIPVKMSSNPAVPRLLALCPRMQEKAAIALIYRYTNIYNIIQAPDKELMEIEGLGKQTIITLKTNVGVI